MKYLPLIATGVLLYSCSTYKITKLLKPHTGKQITYNCEFYNPEVRADTLREQVILEPRSFSIKGHDVYYYHNLLEETDDEIVQSSNYFLDAAFYVEKDTLYAQSLFWDGYRSTLETGDYPIRLSGKVASDDTLHYSDGDFKYALTGFRRVDVKVPFGLLKNCVKLEQITFYADGFGSEDKSSEYIWVHPKYGVVKWIRSTGRTEEMASFKKH